MKTLKSVLLSTSLLMTAPFAAADVEQRVLPGAPAQSAEVSVANIPFETYKTKTTEALLRLLTRDAQVNLSTLRLDNNPSQHQVLCGVRDTLKDLKAKEQRLTDKTTSLQTDLNTAMGEKNALVKELEHTKAALEQIHESNRQAGEHSLAKIRELTDALQKAKEEYNKLYNGRSVAADARAKELEAQLAAKGGGVDNTQLNAANLRVTELEAALAAKDEEIQRLQSASEFTTYVKLVQERDAVTVQRDQRIEKAKHMEALGQLRTQLTADYAASNNSVIQSLERRLAEAETVLAKERTLFDQDLAAANKKLTDLKAEAEKRESQLKGEVARLRELQVATKTEQIQERDNAIAYERELTAAKAQLTAAAKAQLTAAAEAHARELKDANEAHARELKDANEARELELKDANEAHARELTAANEAHARELEAANAKLSAANEAHARELTEANQKLAEALDELRAAQANRVVRSLSYDESRAAAAYATTLANRAAGSAADLSSMHSSASNVHAQQAVDTYNGTQVADLTQLSPFRPDSQDVSPVKPVLTGPFAAVMNAPAVSPDASDHELDNRSPSQAPAWPAPAAATGEDANTAQAATATQLQVEPAVATGEDVTATQGTTAHKNNGGKKRRGGKSA